MEQNIMFMAVHIFPRTQEISSWMLQTSNIFKKRVSVDQFHHLQIQATQAFNLAKKDPLFLLSNHS